MLHQYIEFTNGLYCAGTDPLVPVLTAKLTAKGVFPRPGSARNVWFCYVDESGDSGYFKTKTGAFALGCLLVKDTSWAVALDDITGFRRFVKKSFGVPMRAEIKASDLLHNTGPFRGLKMGDAMRLRLFDLMLALIPKLADGNGIKVFAIVVDKNKMRNFGRTDEDPAHVAWERLIERLERFTHYENDMCSVYPDEGNYDMIRRIVREKRRHSYVPAHFGGSALSRPASFILEDPNPRRSHESYFVQLADLAAYAAYRVIYPGTTFTATYWDRIGDVRVSAVNKIAGGPVGLKIYP